MKRFGWLVALVLVASAWPGAAASSRPAVPTRIEDVIYGRLPGVALTLDVFKPEKPNGIGVLLMVSGGWVSSHEGIRTLIPWIQQLTDRGDTIFAVVHGSQPRYSIPEIVPQIHRAVRFVRSHAKEYGVDPNRLGITGGSAGGHLSLMIGTRGKDGDPAASDPVDRVSSRVQAVACFFPPTDFLNYGKEGQAALGAGVLRPFLPAFGVLPDDEAGRAAFAREISPAYWVTKETPPTLIIHGDADTLVPIQQSELLMKRLDAMSVPHQLEVRPGKGHGWDVAPDVKIIGDWFDTYLTPK